MSLSITLSELCDKSLNADISSSFTKYFWIIRYANKFLADFTILETVILFIRKLALILKIAAYRADNNLGKITQISA